VDVEEDEDEDEEEELEMTMGVAAAEAAVAAEDGGKAEMTAALLLGGCTTMSGCEEDDVALAVAEVAEDEDEDEDCGRVLDAAVAKVSNSSSRSFSEYVR
jgi:hypothetical protein